MSQDLMSISDDCLNVFISTAKDKLSNLYSKLDIGLLRLGVMSLSVNSLQANQFDIIANDDFLHDIISVKSDLNVYHIEKKRRERLKDVSL